MPRLLHHISARYRLTVQMSIFYFLQQNKLDNYICIF